MLLARLRPPNTLPATLGAGEPCAEGARIERPICDSAGEAGAEGCSAAEGARESRREEATRREVRAPGGGVPENMLVEVKGGAVTGNGGMWEARLASWPWAVGFG